MTGPAHYAEAERLIAAAKTATDHFYDEQGAVPTLLAALTHATLASAAAAALGSSREWIEAAGGRLSGAT
jgi:hypothetical protein